MTQELGPQSPSEALAPMAELPPHLDLPVDRYISSYKKRTGALEDIDSKVELARSRITKALKRNNRMSDILESDEFGQIQKETRELLGDCKIGAITCIDGRIPQALVFGTAVDVSKQKAAVLPTAISADTGEIAIDSSTVKIAVINAPTKDDPNLLQLFVAHAGSKDGTKSNCAAAALIRDELLTAGKSVDPDLIKINLDSLQPGVEAIERTYNSAAKNIKKPELERVAVRILYDTDSMGFILGYGEEKTLTTEELTFEFSNLISSHSETDSRFEKPGSLRYSFTDLEHFSENEKLYLELINTLLKDHEFVNRIDSFCANNTGEICGLNDSQRQGLRYILARNVAFQYLTGVHIEKFSSGHPFVNHAEKYMAVSLDDGHGMIVGGMDTEVQSFNAVGAKIQNVVDHIHTMASLMDKHESPKPHILFISRGIEDIVTFSSGALDSVSADLDRTYKEIQKDELIENWVKNGDLIMIPVIQSSKTGRVIRILESPLI